MASGALNVLTIKLPEKYDASSGILVDASSPFGKSVLGAWPMMGSWNGILPELTEEGENNFKNRKCVLRLKYPRAPLTPSGAVSIPTFTGLPGDVGSTSTGKPEGTINKLEFSGVTEVCEKQSAGTPVGKISEILFTGSQTDTSKDSAGLPRGTISEPAFVGEAPSSHTHTFIGAKPKYSVNCIDGCNNTHPSCAAPKGTLTSTDLPIPKGSVSIPVFAGDALPRHSHSVLPNGTVTQPFFVGSPLPEHTHTATPHGNITEPIFEGVTPPPHSHSFIPGGTISKPEFTGAETLVAAAVEIADGTRIHDLLLRTEVLVGVIGL